MADNIIFFCLFLVNSISIFKLRNKDINFRKKERLKWLKEVLWSGNQFGDDFFLLVISFLQYCLAFCTYGKVLFDKIIFFPKHTVVNGSPLRRMPTTILPPLSCVSGVIFPKNYFFSFSSSL